MIFSFLQGRICELEKLGSSQDLHTEACLVNIRCTIFSGLKILQQGLFVLRLPCHFKQVFAHNLKLVNHHISNNPTLFHKAKSIEKNIEKR